MKYLAVIAFTLAAALAVAQRAPMEPQGPFGRGWAGWAPRGDYLAAETTAVKAEMAQKSLGELKGEEIFAIQERLALAVRKDAYVRSSARASLFMPGAGQFRNEDPGAGAGFLAAHLAVSWGSLVGAYFLLPSDLRFNHLNYFSASLGDIRSTWISHSISEYLPFVGVLFAGAIVDGGIRHWSSRSATADAKAMVDSGKARLEPLVGPGFMGMGFRY
jgi:hypothetical protein